MKKTFLYLLFASITFSVLIAGKCNSSSSNSNPPTPPPTGPPQYKSVVVPLEHFNNYLGQLGDSCKYSPGINQILTLAVFYKGADGKDYQWDSVHTYNNMQYPTTTGAGDAVKIDNIVVPNTGDFWLEGVLTLDCTNCCGQTLVLKALGTLGGCQADTLGREIGRPYIKVQSPVYTATGGGNYTEGGVPIIDFDLNVDPSMSGCRCDCN